MIIPKLHYITQGDSPKDHIQNIQNACTSGIELVHLNLEGISEKKHLKLATEARGITSHFQTRLIVNADYKIAKLIKADGVFLNKTDVCPLLARKHLYSWQGIGAEANTLEDCESLITKDVDYIILSPFRNMEITDSLNVELGLKGFTAIVEAVHTETPIIGFKGIRTDDVKSILKTGIVGIAVSDSITKNFDSITLFNQLLRASVIAEQRHTFN